MLEKADDADSKKALEELNGEPVGESADASRRVDTLMRCQMLRLYRCWGATNGLTTDTLSHVGATCRRSAEERGSQLAFSGEPGRRRVHR
jgi:hypothetical protein